MRTILRFPGIGLIFVGASSRLRPADTLQHRARAALILLLFYATSAALEAQDYIYTTNNDATITIIDYTGAGRAVTIPSTIDGMEVTGIGDGAFRWNTNLSSVTIPNSVTSIGDQAFFQCIGLGRVTIPSGVTNLGYGAFAGCAGLTSVAIPNSVTSLFKTFAGCNGLTSVLIGSGVTEISFGIPFGAFGNCTSLTNFTVDTLNPAFSSLDGALFDESQDTLLAYPAGRGGRYNVPNTVTRIANRAFSGCSGLTSVAIPNSVTTIGEFAFYQCAALTKVTIGNGLTGIGGWAFYGCIGLTGLYFTGNAPNLDGPDVFYLANNAIVYYLPGTSGWVSTFGGAPAVLWNPRMQAADGGFSERAHGFGFNITGTTNIPFVVETSTNLVSGAWVQQRTFTLTNGLVSFRDPEWTNYPTRFYRVVVP